MYYEAWGVRGDSAADYKSLQIGHATSTDGVNWVKDPVNPVLPKGNGSDWDCDGTWDPFVLRENGVFKTSTAASRIEWCGGDFIHSGRQRTNNPGAAEIPPTLTLVTEL